MVLSVQYTPKTGINAGKKCFPATCGDFLKSGMYRLEKTDVDGKKQTFCVDDMWEVVKHVEKGCSLFMTPPDGIAFAVTADELIEANPDTFRGVRRNETGMTVSTVKHQPPKNEKQEPDYRAAAGRSGRGGKVSNGVRAVGQEREEDVHVRLRHTEKPLRRRRERKFELHSLRMPVERQALRAFFVCRRDALLR